MTGEGLGQGELCGAGQGCYGHLNALHSTEGHAVRARQEHWRHVERAQQLSATGWLKMADGASVKKRCMIDEVHHDDSTHRYLRRNFFFSSGDNLSKTSQKVTMFGCSA